MTRLREHGLLAALMLLIAPAYVVWAWSDQLGNLGGDAAMYLMMAQSYSPFGPHSPLFDEIARTSRFPPLYPLWLALTGAAGNLVIAHLATVAMLLVGLVALCVWLEISGSSRIQAALVVLGIALLPQTYFLALWPQSEYPYLMFSAIALVALCHHRQSASFNSALLAATAIAAATLTRSIGIALVPPLAVTLVITSRRYAWLLAVAVGPFLLWTLLHHSPSNYAHTFSVYGHDTVARAWAQISAQPRVLGAGFADNFVESGALVRIAVIIGIAALVVMARGLLLLQADAVYVFGYLSIVALWPFPDESARLLWPIVPVLVGRLAIESASIARRASAGERRAVEAAVPIAVLLLVLPRFAFVADRWASASDQPPEFRHLTEWYVDDARRALTLARAYVGTVAQLERLADVVPANECVISVKPELVEYFTDRKSKQPPLNSVPADQFDAAMAALGCPYILMFATQDPVYPVPLHPFARIKDQIDIVDRELMLNPNERYDSVVAVLGRFKQAPHPGTR